MAEQLTLLMLIAQPLCTSADLNLRDRVLGEVEKNSLCQAKGDAAQSTLQNCVPSTLEDLMSL